MHDILSCSYSSLCSGCDWIAKPYSVQRSLKLAHLSQALEALGDSIGDSLNDPSAADTSTTPSQLPKTIRQSEVRASTWKQNGAGRPVAPPIEWIKICLGGLRDRADLMIDRRSGSQRIGLFDRTRSGIVDLQGCPQMSPALESWLHQIRKVDFRVERGSIRLRVSPTGQRGVWLDFANVDIKRLLDERGTLEELRKHAIVEIGQRRKRLVERSDLLKLSDPVLEPWFETYVEDSNGVERAVPLFSTIGTFTQPGFKANQALVRFVREAVREAVLATAAPVAIEFGSGIGNFTLPLASLCREVHAYEVDSLALEGLQRSAQEANLWSRIQIHGGSRSGPLDFSNVDLVLVDPPRSGLMKFLEPMELLRVEERPRLFIYISCYAESFATDAARLLNMRYRLKRLAVVDQFPQSHHYETVAIFERD